MKSSLLIFNTVDRLFRGDFFHAVSPSDIGAKLAEFPGEWGVTGLGTTNWYRRHGEVLIEGTASQPRFLWADPRADAIRDLGPVSVARPLSPSLEEEPGRPHLPFAAVGVWDPRAPDIKERLHKGHDVQAALDALCRDANIGLAALRLSGGLRDVEFQRMCHIPLGGRRTDQPLEALIEEDAGGAWTAVGFYSANPTIRQMIAHEAASVHLHGFADASCRGGHMNRAVAASATIEIRPLHDLLLSIRNLDVAVLPARDLAG